MKYGFGIDLGGTTVKIAYFDETGKMLDKWEIPTVTADGGSQILPDIWLGTISPPATFWASASAFPALSTPRALSISASTWAGVCSISPTPCPPSQASL